MQEGSKNPLRLDHLLFSDSRNLRMKILRTFFYGCVSISCLLAESENLELMIVEDSRVITEVENTPLVSYADVLDKATPSVVAVYTSRIVNASYYHRTPLDLKDFLFRQFGRPLPQEAPEETGRLKRVGVGSGVIISKNGYIITNHHVVQVQRGRTADEISVRLSNDAEYVATLVGSDAKTDVALLKIDVDEELPAIKIADSSKLRVGDILFAIGNPLDVGLTATQGIVSALGRDSSGILGPGAYENFIQTDAAINPGNSGGALIDAAGRLIGINTAIFSKSGGSIGIGFAIPSNLALNVVKNLIETGEVQRGLLGLTPVNLTAELAEAFDLESTRGALVNEVQKDSPAEKGGIQHGDIIVRIDDIEIESAQQLRLIISQMRPNSEVMVTLIRQAETLSLPIILGSVDGSVFGEDSGQDILEGILLETLSKETRRKFSIPKNIDGVVIADMTAKSPYKKVMTLGMAILEVNGKTVNTPEEVSKQLKIGANRFYVWHQETSYYLIIYIQE